MSSFAVLERNTQIFGRHFLEASAGTGKTFTIQHIVVRLLLESTPPLSIKNILVVTFTKAATRELKTRIRSALEKTANDLKRGKGEPYLLPFLEKGEEGIKEALSKIHEALIFFDEAPIFTIHSFCYHMLKECALEIKLPLQLEDPEEIDLQELCHKTILDTLRFHISERDFHPVQIRAVLNDYQGKIENLVKELNYLVLSDDPIAPLKNFEALFSSFKEALCHIQKKGVSSSFQETLDAMIEAHKLQKLKKQTAKEQNGSLCALFQKTQISEEDIAPLLEEKPFFLESLKPQNLSARGKITWGSDAEEKLQWLQEELLPLIQEMTNPSAILLRLGKLCRLRFEEELKKKQLLSFHLMIHKMEEATRDPSVIKKLLPLFSAVIIDEFQDTDKAQWAIFSRLFLNEDVKAFYLVGDPKQSIYGFRSADVYTYLEAKTIFGEKAVAHLDTCYRSTSQLSEALNTFFGSWSWMHLPEKNLEIPYHKVKSAIIQENKEDCSLQFLFIEDPDAKGLKFPSEEGEEKLFSFIQKEIKRLGQEKKISFHHMALLVKDRFQAERAFDYFKNHHIPAVIKRASPLVETLAYELLLLFLETLCHPRKLAAIKNLLISDWFHFPPPMLKGKMENPLIVYSLEKLAILKEVYRKRGIASCFKAFLETTWQQKTTSVISYIISLYGEEVYGHLLQLMEKLIEVENKQSGSLPKLHRTLIHLKKRSVNEDLYAIQPAAQEALNILTTHMSKGLEFDVVFALGTSSRTPASHGYLAVRQNDSRSLIPFDERSPLCLSAVKEVDAEKLRQLYVALTRAKSYVYIPIFSASDSLAPLGSSSPIELFFTQNGKTSYDIESIKLRINEWKKSASIDSREITRPLHLEISDSSISLIEKDSIACKELPLIPRCKETVLSFSSLHQSVKDWSLETSPNEDTLPSGPEFGNFFHAAMEEILLRGIYFPYDATAVCSLIEHLAVGTPYSSFTQEITRAIESVFHLFLSDGHESFTLAEIPPSQVFVEMEFLFPHLMIDIKGFTDLIFERKGKYYLLDWKTNHLNHYETCDLIQEMEKHNYFLQASIYAEALKRYLNLFEKGEFAGAFYLFIRKPAFHFFLPESLPSDLLLLGDP